MSRVVRVDRQADGRLIVIARSWAKGGPWEKGGLINDGLWVLGAGASAEQIGVAVASAAARCREGLPEPTQDPNRELLALTGFTSIEDYDAAGRLVELGATDAGSNLLHVVSVVPLQYSPPGGRSFTVLREHRREFTDPDASVIGQGVLDAFTALDAELAKPPAPPPVDLDSPSLQKAGVDLRPNGDRVIYTMSRRKNGWMIDGAPVVLGPSADTGELGVALLKVLGRSLIGLPEWDFWHGPGPDQEMLDLLGVTRRQYDKGLRTVDVSADFVLAPGEVKFVPYKPMPGHRGAFVPAEKDRTVSFTSAAELGTGVLAALDDAVA